jgi:hypothetical protein
VIMNHGGTQLQIELPLPMINDAVKDVSSCSCIIIYEQSDKMIAHRLDCLTTSEDAVLCYIVTCVSCCSCI